MAGEGAGAGLPGGMPRPAGLGGLHRLRPAAAPRAAQAWLEPKHVLATDPVRRVACRRLPEPARRRGAVKSWTRPARLGLRRADVIPCAAFERRGVPPPKPPEPRARPASKRGLERYP